MSTLTDEQRANLDKLATYLEGLPKRYKHFGMGVWITGADGKAIVRYALENGGVSSCGAVACAVGHGPAAGILVPGSMVTLDCYGPSVDWWNYAEQAFGVCHDWCFESDWDTIDNHHYGAAARIRYLLDKGEPPEGFEDPARKWRKVYAPYRIDAKVPA
jgi:hypothetical protein